MAFYIVGTAGHIDHGKSSLVKLLTKVDPDRFEEEKRRGMTIELGFAPLTLPSGNEVGFIDVPGHEKFIRNMLAGAAGIDVVLLVIAADEGIMPQTQEHFEILNLLGVKTGLVVLTKIDLVEDSTWLELVETELKEQFKGSFLENSPIIRFSSVTGKGKEELLSALDEAVKEVEPKKQSLPARFPIDWVFTKPGFGTVVRGTLWEGEVALDSKLLLFPHSQTVRIRGIHSFGKNLNKGVAGQRLALNLASIAKQDIKRGDVLVEPGYYKTTKLLDCRLTLLKKPIKLKQGDEVLFYLGTKETTARIRIFENEEVRSGMTCLVQLRLAEQVVARRKDRFIIRRPSPLQTIGGGEVIYPYPPPRHRFKPETISHLKNLLNASDKEYLLEILKEKGAMEKKEVDFFLVQKPEKTKEIIGSLANEKKILTFGNLIVLVKEFNAKLSELLSLLEENFRMNPLNPYLSKELLRNQLNVGKTLMEELVKRLQNEGKIEISGEKLKFKVKETEKLNFENQDLKEKVEKLFLEKPFSPPLPEELKAKFPKKEREAEQMIYRLINEKLLIKIGPSYFHQKTIEKAKMIIRENIKDRGPLTAAEIKELLGSTRKFVIPLLEFLDRQRFTRRVGDKRELIE